ncbi:DUF4912 domain-containing protein [Mangrovibacillus cuniculi]|uniref:DUF4912 domain-containing protein n=1 Tax=Mangrovibacillus cuniculi TaxID=2593652 RepID=A0A7S8HFX3_9BACI|nr:DUF4912 domain-containing protein [Mangrovibacillus cuniculi]QPC46880.1 DUF4912 domain-containing protein [Mangrovibacillus cuniculi]
MIEQILALREQGMSFRKIADEIGSTVGKVQYRWNKYMKELEVMQAEEQVAATVLEEQVETPVVKIEKKFAPTSLVCHFTHASTVMVMWESVKLELDIIKNLYDLKVDELQLVLRAHNITAIEFNGWNSHYYQDILLPAKGEEGSWVVRGLKGGNSYLLQLGILTPMRKFFPINQSQPIHAPRLTKDQQNFVTKAIMSKAIETVKPQWIEHVSTYTYYGQEERGEKNE